MNFLNSSFFDHLTKEGIVLRELRCRIFSMDRQAPKAIANMNMSKFEKLALQIATVDP